MKPMIIIPPGLMTADDIKVLRDNEICVVEAKEPAKIKFVDTIPAQSSRTVIEDACIKLTRMVLNGRWKHLWNADQLGQSAFAHIYVQMLLEGTPLDINGTREEQEQRIIDNARRDELARIGREEARTEAAARKKAKLSGVKQSETVK